MAKQNPAEKAEAILDHIISIKGGTSRPGQIDMARRVATAETPLLIQGGTGIGKALDLNTPIPTPDRGFVPMGELAVGDKVFDEHGRPCTVTEVFNTLTNRDCYRITFNSKASLVVDGDHQFTTLNTYEYRKQARLTDGTDPWAFASVRTTNTIKDTLSRQDRSNHRIPLAQPAQFDHHSLPVDPYELGFWLGGSDRRSNEATALNDLVGHDFTHFDTSSRTPGNKRTRLIATTETATALKTLGLWGQNEKHIPAAYLTADEPQRRALLAGFLDAVGWLARPARSKTAQVNVYKNQYRLMDELYVLIASLGFRASVLENDTADASYKHISFTPHRQVFAYHPKRDDLGIEDDSEALGGFHVIRGIEKVSSRPVRCIMVDSASHLYLAGEGFIPTHNSLAYLAGAVASGRRTAVAPHTKALQDQLRQDLELMAGAFADGQGSKVLDRAPTFAVLKGRSSYFCGNRLLAEPDPEGAQETLDVAPEAGAESSTSGDGSGLAEEIRTLVEWSKTTETGDRNEAPPVSYQAWAAVCGSSDDCSANGCKNTPELCFAEKAREEAGEADIVVANQAYLAQAMRIDQVSLGDVDAVVIDEAHEFPSVVAEAFGARINRARVEQTMTKTLNMLDRESLMTEDATDRAEKDLGKYLDDLDRALQKMSKFGNDRDIVSTEPVLTAVNETMNLFSSIATKTQLARDRAAEEKEKQKRSNLHNEVENLVADLQLIAKGTDDYQVVWAEKAQGVPILRAARFDVSKTIHDRLIDRLCSGKVVMTSATLQVGGSFDYPAEQMGFTLDPDQYPWEGHEVVSPFDYRQQGLVWLPAAMPDPTNREPGGQEAYQDAVVDQTVKAARAAGGRTLVLCTSKKSVREISQKLDESLSGEGITVLSQEYGRSLKELVEEFTSTDHAVLVGTRSFWTGISLEGDACTCVVIEKIPFPTPDDPVTAARVDKVNRHEGRGQGFMKVALSEATLTIVQGMGRLIRTITDRGVVVVCDPRLNPKSEFKKSYWQTITRSLPDFASTLSEDRTLGALSDIAATADDEDTTAVVEVQPAETPDQARADAQATATP